MATDDVADLQANAKKWNELAHLKEDERDTDYGALNEDPDNPTLKTILARSKRLLCRYRNAATLSENASKAVQDIYAAVRALGVLNSQFEYRYENIDDDTIVLVRNAVSNAEDRINAELKRCRTIAAAARGSDEAKAELTAAAEARKRARIN